MGSDNGTKVLPSWGILREAAIFFAGSLMAFVLMRSPTSQAADALRGRGEMTILGNSNGPWKSIHTFYGSNTHFYGKVDTKYHIDASPTHNGNEWLGQWGQDVAVASFFKFKKNGFFIDLASNHAFKASNTFTLEQNYGWNGICIEPNSIYWKDLSYRKCEVVAAFIGAKDMDEIEVTISSDAGPAPYGGIVGKDFKNKSVRKNARQAEYSVSLKTILAKFNAPKVIDFLSLDIEGAELFVMENFPFDEYTFLTLAIESPGEELSNLLAKKGYKQVYKFKKGADIMFAHESVYEEGKAEVERNSEQIESHVVPV